MTDRAGPAGEVGSDHDVLGKFTDKARRVVVLAQEEACVLRHDHVGPEHLFLGLIGEGTSCAARALRSVGLGLEAARERVARVVGEGEQASSGYVPFSASAKELLALAWKEALPYGHGWVEPEHILLGLIRENGVVATEVLERLGAERGGAPDDDLAVQMAATDDGLIDPNLASTPALAGQLRALSLALSLLADKTGSLSWRGQEAEADRALLAITAADDPDRPSRMYFLGSSLLTIADRSGDASTLSEAVELLRAAVVTMPASNQFRAAALDGLCSGAQRLAAASDDPKLLAEATTVLGELVTGSRAAIEATPADDAARPQRMAELAYHLRLLYAQTGEAGVLAEAIRVGRDAAGQAGAEPGLRAWYLAGLARDLVVMYQATDRQVWLTEAADRARAAAALVLAHDAEGAEALDLSAMVLVYKSGLSDDVPDLEQAIHWQRAAIARAGDRAERAAYLGHFSNSLVLFSHFTAAPAALAEAIEAGRGAIAGLPPDHPERPETLNTLGNSLFAHFEQTADAAALAEAVSVSRAAVAGMSPDAPDRARYLADLADVLHGWSERRGDPAALSDAVEVSRAAVSAAPDRDPRRERCLRLLGACLLSQCERNGDMQALEESVATLRAALSGARPGHDEHVACMLLLADALRLKSDRTTGDGSRWLDEAIKLSRSAAAAAGDAAERALCLGRLGECLRERFERTGERRWLAEAVEAGREALAACPRQDPARAILLSYLSGSLRILFMETRDLSLVTQAIDYAREAIAITPADHPVIAVYQNTLLGCLLFLYARTSEVDVLIAAVAAARAAVAAMADGTPGRQDGLSNLGIALQSLAQRTGDADLMREAVHCGRAALADAPADLPARPSRLNNLAESLRNLAVLTGEASHAAEAVAAFREAAAIMPPGHPYRATALMNLGRALMAEAALDHSDAGPAEAEICLAEAGADRSASVVIRLLAWSRASMVAGRRKGGADAALAAAEAAAALLPQLAPGAMTLSDRFYWLGGISTLAAQAASAAVMAGRPGRAVELLEQTRGAATADLVDSRSGDEARLRASAPALARELELVRARLATSGDDAIGQAAVPGLRRGSDQAPLADLGRARLDAQADWDDLVARIRAADGFAAFGTTAPASELTTLASDGEIVVVYAGPDRGDALILTGDPASPVRLVPLPGLTEAAAVARADALSAACRLDAAEAGRAEWKAAQADVLDMLAWLWDTVAAPVLAATGRAAKVTRDESWPRVWWCPVGVMAELPLHCAGYHADLASDDPEVRANPRTVLDRVVSCYATTLRGLGQARERRASGTGRASRITRGAGKRMLIVTAPKIPGSDALPGATAEAEIIGSLVRGAKVLSAPVRSDVLRELRRHEMVHFACHARLNSLDPASSYLVLRDHERAPLTVADIGAEDLPGQLAFLSACDTGVTTRQFSNETVHLSGAFHVAGYQRVVGTLWPVADDAAAELSAGFYQRLTGNGAEQPRPDRAAIALHGAVRELRRRYPNAPTLWAAYTYTGI
ncbi:MAG TPA: CHAT domain-containing protein [Streptosporangiaceae bacterium]|nr:CHAT domain-containing protein [Streptosporangiaceae bacterium]